MYPYGQGKQVFRFGGKGKGMSPKKWQIHQLNFTHKRLWMQATSSRLQASSQTYPKMWRLVILCRGLSLKLAACSLKLKTQTLLSTFTDKTVF